MLSQQLLKKIGMSKKEMQEIIRHADFYHRLRALFELSEFSSERLGILYELIAPSFCQMPGDGWLQYCFDWGKHMYCPDNFPDTRREACEPGRIWFLELLRFCVRMEEMIFGTNPLRHIHLEAANTDDGLERDEYACFYKTMQELYVPEFMRIASEITPFNTLGHIAGVHYISVHMAEQLKALGEDVDISLTSAVALGHDIGKFGCRDMESRRVPYLHYYYTDQFFRRHHMPVIGSIAANHSTWDLELENLSVESLLLIYADFRVKSTRDESGREIVHFYSLKDSFDVILGKLDNVDEAKRSRYCRVYEKLSDFESYMIHIGVNPDPYLFGHTRLSEKDSALLSFDETIAAYKDRAVAHNVRLMHVLNHEESFGTLLENARSTKDWKNIRSYLNLFSEYCTYLHQRQKLLTINFLYELLMHKEGDIRLRAAQLLGRLIMLYDVEYRKEVPIGREMMPDDESSLELFEKYTNRILREHHKLTEHHRAWLISMIGAFLESVLTQARNDSIRAVILKQITELFDSRQWDTYTAICLLRATQVLPLSSMSREQWLILYRFASHYAKRDNQDLRLNALKFIEASLDELPIDEELASLCLSLSNAIPDAYTISFRFMKHMIACKATSRPDSSEEWYEKEAKKVLSEIFLENLKTATCATCKEVNMEFLLYITCLQKNTQPVHTTTHLANLLMGSEHRDVRMKAGRILTAIAHHISIDQCNEVVMELMKGLELGENEFSKYIPDYLGEMILYLNTNEIAECMQSLEKLLFSESASAMILSLDTMSVMLQKLPAHWRSAEFKHYNDARSLQKKILRLMLRGLANSIEKVSQEAVYLIGEHIFGSPYLTLDDKADIFYFCGKKILHILSDNPGGELSFFIRAASLNHIYRFLTDLALSDKKLPAEADRKAALFPGTFDPFSLGHKGIVQEIRRLGFEVYLAIDEFSWSKKTQPRLIRRRLAAMSNADDEGVFMFPDDIPVNIANPSDLHRLRSLLPGRDIYIVVGRDVIDNASAYKKPVEEGSIHTFNHIVFRRHSNDVLAEADTTEETYHEITAKVIELSLPLHLEDISSTSIRESVDMNRDISHLVDPMAQSFIYRNSLYLREPQYKTLLRSGLFYSEVCPEITPQIYQQLKQHIFVGKKMREAFNHMRQQFPDCRFILLRDDKRGGAPLAVAVYREIESSELLDEFNDLRICSHIRAQSGGKTAILMTIYCQPSRRQSSHIHLAMSESLADMVGNGFTYCLYHEKYQPVEECAPITATLHRFGFVPITDTHSLKTVYTVNMHSPSTLTDNMRMVFKEPFNTNPRVLDVLQRTSIRLQQAIADMRPGHLTLSLDSGMMNRRLVNLIAEENQVPNHQTDKRMLGPHMCVPFGKLFRGTVAPNTVTKAIHTEKVFSKDISSFTVQEYPGYSPIPVQVNTIKSFNRHVILVDDILHSGTRLNHLDPLIKETGIHVNKVMVGILSARGKDMAKLRGYTADSAYYIPNLHSWIIESSMYPFIGGDSIEGSDATTAGLLTSINMILPYIAPAFLIRDGQQAAYDLSMVCLENARDILRVIEDEYQIEFSRNLTLDRLSEVVINPTCPDRGQHMAYDVNLPASAYVENDIQRLVRIRKLFSLVAPEKLSKLDYHNMTDA